MVFALNSVVSFRKSFTAWIGSTLAIAAVKAVVVSLEAPTERSTVLVSSFVVMVIFLFVDN